MITQSALVLWASVAVKSAYNIGFNNYQQQLSAAKGNFTSDGWDSFMTALDSSGLLTQVKS